MGGMNPELGEAKVRKSQKDRNLALDALPELANDFKHTSEGSRVQPTL